MLGSPHAHWIGMLLKHFGPFWKAGSTRPSAWPVAGATAIRVFDNRPQIAKTAGNGFLIAYLSQVFIMS
jgi:hypothetical protein